MIEFEPLHRRHFPLLLRWLKTPHVKRWWDSDVDWTLELVKQKYTDYAQGFKMADGIGKPIYAFIIKVNNKEIGYIQYYDAYDFPRTPALHYLPKSLATMDLFIGEAKCLGKGLAVPIIKQFLEEHVNTKFDNCFVDPDQDNVIAFRAYLSAGFKLIKTHPNVLWMLCQKRNPEL